MADTPLVSILINNYNYGRFLGEAIDSALSQTYPNTEVIVVDDGSTDNSREVIATYGDRIISILKENGGQASAFNAGFAASAGEVICFLDADDYFLKYKASEIARLFIEHPHIGWVFHNLRLVDTQTGEPIEIKVDLTSGFYDFRNSIRQGKLPFAGPATSAISFSRSVIEKILPMPVAPHISLSEKYIKRLGMALSPGFFTEQFLAIQRIHNNNALTLQDNKVQLRARMNMLTAHWMRVNFPEFSRLANTTFAFGIERYWYSGGIEEDYKSLASEYWSATPVWAKLEIALRIVYRRVKSFL